MHAISGVFYLWLDEVPSWTPGSLGSVITVGDFPPALPAVPPLTGRWKNMDVAVKVMLFQNMTLAATNSAAEVKLQLARKLVLQEAALCCSMSHPNVVATYNYDVLVASAMHDTPSGLHITDKSGEGTFKLYLIQV